MNDRNSKLKELFGEMSDFSDEESQPSRDRPPTPGRDIIIVPRVGTTVQRGDRETARRAAAMAAPPPPLPTKCRAEGPASPTRKSVVNDANVERATSLSPAEGRTTTGAPGAADSVAANLGIDARTPSLGDGGRPESWSSRRRPDRRLFGLCCPRDGRWISRSSRYTESGSTSFGSPVTAG